MMTRDNSHIKLPAGGSTLDGMDRARLLNLKVRIGRVGNNGDSVVGRISVASFDSADRLVKNGLMENFSSARRLGGLSHSLVFGACMSG